MYVRNIESPPSLSHSQYIPYEHTPRTDSPQKMSPMVKEVNSIRRFKIPKMIQIVFLCHIAIMVYWSAIKLATTLDEELNRTYYALS